MCSFEMCVTSKGNPEEHTIYEFAEIIKKEVGMYVGSCYGEEN